MTDTKKSEAEATAKGKPPSHLVFACGDDNAVEWNEIGRAWAHKDGNGLTLTLTAAYTGTKLVLRRNRGRQAKAA